MLHALDAGSPQNVRSGMRVRVRWRAERVGEIQDIACFIAEPIQSEGGDNHMRPEFLQAMQRLCRENDALLILDEVQTGVGTAGTAWAARAANSSNPNLRRMRSRYIGAL